MALRDRRPWFRRMFPRLFRPAGWETERDREVTVAAMQRWAEASERAGSPDVSRVAFIVMHVDAFGDQLHREIFHVDSVEGQRMCGLLADDLARIVAGRDAA